MAGVKKINPPFRADIVGSFLRPERLLQARRQAGFDLDSTAEREGGGTLSIEELHKIEDGAIRELVKFEEDVGLKAVTDGEFRRGSWAYDLTARIKGVELKPQEDFEAKFTGGFRPPISHTVARLGRNPGGIAVDDVKFTMGLTDRMVKATIPSPTLMYVRGGRRCVSEDVYPDLDEFFEDLKQVYRDEISDLYAAGCRYVQIDNVDAALICDPKFQEQSRRNGIDPGEQVHIQADLISGATKDRPEDMTVSMHLCRGNSAGNWLAEGGYDYVAETLFSEFDVDAYFLEYDTDRAGDFTPLRFAPKDKLIVLGLITTKTPENHSKDILLSRIEEAAGYVPLENLAISPQCGFASAAKGNPITFDDQRRKLDLMMEVAEHVWGGV